LYLENLPAESLVELVFKHLLLVEPKVSPVQLNLVTKRNDVVGSQLLSQVLSVVLHLWRVSHLILVVHRLVH